MTVRNSWVTQGKEAAGFIDKAEFEQIKRQGDLAVHRWIDKQLSLFIYKCVITDLINNRILTEIVDEGITGYAFV